MNKLLQNVLKAFAQKSRGVAKKASPVAPVAGPPKPTPPPMPQRDTQVLSVPPHPPAFAYGEVPGAPYMNYPNYSNTFRAPTQPDRAIPNNVTHAALTIPPSTPFMNNVSTSLPVPQSSFDPQGWMTTPSAHSNLPVPQKQQIMQKAIGNVPKPAAPKDHTNTAQIISNHYLTQ